MSVLRLPSEGSCGVGNVDGAEKAPLIFLVAETTTGRGERARFL